jgi:hypothetical protein
MRYNSYDDEWDICHEFSPTAQVDDTDPFGNDVYEYEEDGEITASDLVPAPPTLSTVQRAPSIETTRQDILTMFGRGDSHTTAAAPKFPATLDHQLFQRLGFDWEPIGDPVEPVSPTEWDRVLHILQDRDSPVDEVFKGPIARFVTTLLETTAGEFPALSWDLHSSSPSCLRDRIGYKLTIDSRVVKVLESRHRDAISGPKEKDASIEETRYLLRPQSHTDENSVDWLLVVASPTAALQCVRFCATNVADTARFCIQRGIPFKTFAQLQPQPAQPHFRRPRITLGVRYPGYQPDAADYAAYEAARDFFLRSPSARAALLEGGIVWRLAVEFIPPGTVLAGPSEVAFTSGQVIRIPGAGDYCDDEVSENEADLVCGVYEIYTGKSTRLC